MQLCEHVDPKIACEAALCVGYLGPIPPSLLLPMHVRRLRLPLESALRAQVLVFASSKLFVRETDVQAASEAEDVPENKVLPIEYLFLISPLSEKEFLLINLGILYCSTYFLLALAMHPIAPPMRLISA